MLDGEGGYTVYGRLMPAARSLALGALPIGLAHSCRVVRPVAPHRCLTWDDVAMEPSVALALRREMESRYASNPERTALHEEIRG